MPIWKEENRAAFAACVGTLLAEPMVQALRDYHQHTAVTTRLDHCIVVAYFSFLICRRMGLDYKAAARGGLLHDLYMDRWPGSESGALARWRTHPVAAAHNARIYGLNHKEEDIIRKHMWPLTPEKPACKEGYVVSCADKMAAVLEKTRLTHLLGIRRSIQLVQAVAQ